MKNLLRNNIGLVFPRILRERFSHGFVVNTIADVKVGGRISGSETNVSPLYLYPNKDECKQNFDVNFLRIINKNLDNKITPEGILYYIYAILYSPYYREHYDEFLRIDFPRVPFTRNHILFMKIAHLGEKLVNLHLLNAPDLLVANTKFQGSGNNLIEKSEYIEKEERIYVNETQYFEKIVPEIWEYLIGGYQVLYQWLKHRKGRILSLEDIKHFCKTATAIKVTIDIQSEIDKLYPDIEKEIIEFRKNSENADLKGYMH